MDLSKRDLINLLHDLQNLEVHIPQKNPGIVDYKILGWQSCKFWQYRNKTSTSYHTLW